MTPERLLYLLILMKDIPIEYLFIDEAHKISKKDGRSAFYYKVVDMLSQRSTPPHIIFASPNIPNPEVYLQLIPDVANRENYKIATKFSPVNQEKFLIDFKCFELHYYNEATQKLTKYCSFPEDKGLLDFVHELGEGARSIVYSNSKDNVVEYALQYATQLQPLHDSDLDVLAQDIRQDVHGDYYLADIVEKGVAYHMGYLPSTIRARIESLYKDGKIHTLFCTSTLLEGVNLPADNLFITSHKNGGDMSPVDFRNLMGRVGRIEFNLYGNVFLVCIKRKTKKERFLHLLQEKIVPQQLSLATALTPEQKTGIVSVLKSGQAEIPKDGSLPPAEYSLIRKVANILLKDIVSGRASRVKKEFSDVLSPEDEAAIVAAFAGREHSLDDDINLSLDQTERLAREIRSGRLHYPAIRIGGKADYNELRNFLERLCDIFKWETYEYDTLGFRNKLSGAHTKLSHYAFVLNQWVSGMSLNHMVTDSIDYYRSTGKGKVLPSELISELINDKRHYEWLPVSLTETGPYKDVLSYFSSILGIEVIRPEDLRSYFNDNHSFLENRDNDWLVRLYKLYETVPNIFSESNYRNILDAVIVRTASNRMVAPYRKSQSSYLPNVFLPSKKAMQAEVEFVHPYLFEKCRAFFENVLHLKTPNEYEHFVKSLEKRYAGTDFSGSFEEHVQDIHALVKYLRNSDYEADLRQIVRKAFYIKCRSGGKAYWARPHSKVIRFPQSETGLMLEQYYKGIAPDIYFVDFDAYQSAGITFDDLRALGVTDKIITGDEKTWGEYYTGNPGRQPEWRTTGDFRWKLGIDKLEEALLYISQHAKAKDALIKSQVIFKTLQENMSRLVGTVYIGGGTPNKYDEPADVIHTLNRDGFNWRFSDWNGKWLYTESGELVSHKAISKHDLNKALYGKVSLDSNLYDILGFKKGKIDQHEAIVKDYDALPDEKKQSYFEIELERRFHITPEQLSREFGGLSLQEGSSGQSEEDEFEFPTGSVKNWEALKKHAAQILSYASPTVYATVVRRIRVSRPQDDVRAYLMNMYRVNSSYRYACQLCHKPFSNVEMCQLEQKPDVELDPLNVCLCPNCAAKFRTLRNDKYLADRLIDSILDVSENEIEENDHVSVAINDYDFWFTPTHIAEIIELLKLKKKAAEERKAQPQTASKPNAKAVAKAPESNRAAPVQPVKEETPPSTPEPEEEGLQSDTSAYGELIGRRVFHKSKKAYARVVGCDGEYVVLNFESGDKAGQDVRYNLTMCLNNGWIEVVD